MNIIQQRLPDGAPLLVPSQTPIGNSIFPGDPVKKIQGILCCTAAFVHLSSTPMSAQDKNPSVSIPVTELKFGSAGVDPIQVAKGFSTSVNDAHGTFTKLPAGFASPVHNHSLGYYGVVITGVIVNGTAGSKDVPLPPGSYWFQKGGEDHVTKCVSANECVAFISQTGKFDFVPEKK